MKKSINFFATVAFFAMSLTSCGGSSKQDASATDTIATITVDEVFVNPDSLVGQEITIEGVCSHLCKHGGKKAFVLGTGSSQLLRCESTPEMGGAFSKETIHKPISVTGILREERIDEAAVKRMEEQYANQESTVDATTEAAVGCDTERQARGQADITTIEDRMKDYRIRIAQRDSIEGKPYLSFYYLESKSYEILPE